VIQVLIYLDNCCFNRPFDEQSSVIIQLETDAKLHIQRLIRSGKLKLCWSFVLDYENAANPYEDIRNQISEWKRISEVDCEFSDEILTLATQYMSQGLRQMDASHVACAVSLGAEAFLTTDKGILKKKFTDILIMNPIDFIRRYFDEE
jgi:predicted nucleic acid-binding protein